MNIKLSDAKVIKKWRDHSNNLYVLYGIPKMLNSYKAQF
jgi:hypothetical protein